MIGAMLITFLYLTQTEKDTKMSEDPAITTLIIAATYVAVVGYTETGFVMSGSPFNPASALGLTFAILVQSDIRNTQGIWVFLIFSYLGSLLAVVLFECVYKRAMAVSAREADHEDLSDDDGRQENQNLIDPPAGNIVNTTY